MWEIVQQSSHLLRASITMIVCLMFVHVLSGAGFLMQISQPCTCRNKGTILGSRGYLGSFPPLSPFQDQTQPVPPLFIGFHLLESHHSAKYRRQAMIPLRPLRFSSDPTVFSLDTPEITGGEIINTLTVPSTLSQTFATQPTTTVQPEPTAVTTSPLTTSATGSGGSKQVFRAGGLVWGITTTATISGLVLTLIPRFV